jgi:hypothetical protein
MTQIVHEDPLESEIRRGCERLAACPTTHPERGNACHDLATSLYRSWTLTPSTALLDEVITLHREALALRPSGHPDHAASCNSLGSALRRHYDVTGGHDLLEEIIKLHYKAITLHPGGHPDRATSCNGLGAALCRRYSVTGGSGLLDEIITLHREATVLRSVGHPDRAESCNNLATALWLRYQVTGSSGLLDEIITLHREALALRPGEHPDRSESCNNLGRALHIRYEVTSRSNLLNEAIELHREALALRPQGHSYRSESCNDLADSLWQRFRQTRDVTVVDEALALAHENAASAPPSEVWRSLLFLVLVHMEQASPHFSVSTAMKYLLQSSASLPPNSTKFMRKVQSCLNRMWLMHGTWTPDVNLKLADVYSHIIDGLSRMTGFALDTISQLAALRSARSFGSDACMAALLSGRRRQAIELIDHAHGVIWTQALHQRDPQLQDVPRDLASELESLFRAVSIPITKHERAPVGHATGCLSPEDVRDQQNSRIQTLLTEVRAIPGLERFMLGRTYAQVREAAHEHPVVVLVSARGYVYALIIRDSAQENPDTLHLELTSDRLSLLRDTAASVGLRNENSPQDVEIQFGRAMHVSKRRETTALSTLADLWHDIVKPVIDHLQLQVRIGVPVIGA